MKLQTRRWYSITQDVPDPQSTLPLRKVAGIVIVENPFAGRYVENLEPMIEASAALGRELATIVPSALAPYSAQSYGKAAIVGTRRRAGARQRAAHDRRSPSRCARRSAAARPGSPP